MSSQKWHERDGVIRFSVTTDSMTGPELDEYAKGRFGIGDIAKSVILSQGFKSMKAGRTIQIAVLRGSSFKDAVRVTNNIRKEAARNEFETPNPHIARLICGKFTDKDIEAMGLEAIVVAHDPIEDSFGVSRLLGAFRGVWGYNMDAFSGFPVHRWPPDYGFAFCDAQ